MTVKEISSKLWENLEKYVVIAGLLIMLGVTFLNVLSRYFLNMSLSFMETLTINLFIWVALFGSGLAARRGAHLGLSILTDIWPPLRKVSLLLTLLCSLFLYSTIAWFGFQLIKTQMIRGQMSATLNIPEWILTISVPLGCFIIIIRFIELVAHEWKKGEAI